MVHQKFRKWFGKDFAEVIKIIAIVIELDDLNHGRVDDMVINIDEENEGRDTTLNEEMPKIKKRRSISIPSLRRQSGKSVSFKVLD